MFRRQTFQVWDSHYSYWRLLLTCFWSTRCAHNLGMIFIYKGIAVSESKFHFEIKDWDFLTAGSHLATNVEFWHIVKAKRKGYHARNAKPLIGGWLQLFMQMCKIFFLFFQECFSFRNGTLALKNYSWEFQTALLLLNVYYLRWIFRPT